MKMIATLTITKQITIDSIPYKYRDFFNAWFKDEDDRTDEDWDLLEQHSFEEMFSHITGETVVDVDIDDFDLIVP